MGLKEFWKLNKYSYLWSCLGVTLGALFIGAMKKYDMTATSLFILVSFPIIFLMAFGISSFIGGNE
jgi:hypothetical protein